MLFCTDVDLLHWEPNIFRDAAFASQLLLAGTADLAGTTLTVAAGSLADAHVSAGQVVHLSGTIEGSYPIISVDGPAQLTLSVLYDGLYGEPAGEASPVGSANGVNFAIRTFWPQRRVVSGLLLRAAGIGPETGAPASAAILNMEALRRPCVLGTLQMIYSALAAAAEEPAPLNVRAELYQRLYRRSLEQTVLQLDFNGDGRADTMRRLNVVRLVRC